MNKFERMCTSDIVYSAATLQVKPATALSLPARPFTRYMSLSLKNQPGYIQSFLNECLLQSCGEEFENQKKK